MKKKAVLLFCGRPQNESVRLIEGNGVYICEECISLCQSILDDSQPTLDEYSSTKKAAIKHC